MDGQQRGRWTAAWAAWAALMAAGATGCAPRAGTPDTLVFARASDAVSLDPAGMNDGQSVNTVAQCLEGLLRFRPGTLEVEPWLAERFEISPDGLVYRFQIRSGVTFHDGTPLTAETAAFSFRRQLDERHPAHFPNLSYEYWQTLYSDIVEVRAPAAMTLELVLRQPNSTLLASLAAFPVYLISPAAFAQHGPLLGQHPVGTGPFRFVEWRPSEAVVFARHPAYWGPAPAIERLVIQVVPDNTARVLQLREGQIDAMDGVNPADAEALKQDPAFRVHSTPGMNLGYLAFSEFAPHLRHPEVRRAVALAIDKDNLVRLGLDGYGRPAHYPMAKGMLGEPAGPPPLTHDREAARALLARHPEVLARPITLAAFTGARDYFPDASKIASLIAEDLRAVGLRVVPEIREFQSHRELLETGRFEMGLLGWIGDNGDPDNFLATLLGSAGAIEGSATNVAFWKNPAFDEALERARRVSAPAERAALYGEALRLWQEALPLVPLVHGEQIVAFRAAWDGFVMEPTGIVHIAPVRPAAK